MTLLKKPVSVVLIGVYYLLSPVLNLVQIALYTGLSWTGPVPLWTALTPLDWAILAAFPMVGIGVLRVRRWGWMVFVGFTVFLIGHNTLAFAVNQTYSLAMVVLSNLGLAAVTGIFFRRHLRAPYFNPRLRWWTVDPRYPTSLAARIDLPTEGCTAEVLDLSQSGAFLSTCGDLAVGDRVQMHLDAYGQSLACTGRVMRKTPPDTPQPGFGVMFEALDPAAALHLRGLLAALVKEGARERGLPPEAPAPGDPWPRQLAWHAKRLGQELIGA